MHLIKMKCRMGAVITVNNRIIARGFNQVEMLNDPTAHAEMIALTSAFNFIGAKYLTDAALYVTVEPCLMCCGALYWSKINKVVYGAADEKNGYRRTTKKTITPSSKNDYYTWHSLEEMRLVR